MRKLVIKLLCSFMIASSFTTVFANEETGDTDVEIDEGALNDLDDGYDVDIEEVKDEDDADDVYVPSESTDKAVDDSTGTEGEGTATENIIYREPSSTEETTSESETEDDQSNDEAVALSNNNAPSIVNVTTLSYSTHVQDYGWMNTVSSKQTSGTTGQSKRVEALKVGLPNELAALGDIKVEVHVQDYGWMGAVGNNQIAGTTGQSKILTSNNFVPRR